MIDILERLQLLTEGLADVRKAFVDTDKITAADFDALTELDPTETKKYMPWMAKAFVEHPELELFQTIAHFDTVLKKGLLKKEERDLNSYKDIEAVIDRVKYYEDVKTKGEAERDIKMKGSIKVFENDDVVILSITSKDASCYYGKGTKWCVAATQSSNLWNSYYNKQLLDFFFILNKKLEPYDPAERTGDKMSKLAVVVDSRNRIDSVWDAPDNHLGQTEINEYLKKYNIPESIFKHGGLSPERIIISKIDGTYTIGEDGRYIVKGDVEFRRWQEEKLPIKFALVSGDFRMDESKITSLEGCPERVGGKFDLEDCQALTSLQGGPKIVRGGYSIEGCKKITSLVGGPEQVGTENTRMNRRSSYSGTYNISETGITTLEGMPTKIVGDINARQCQLTSLKGAQQTGKSWDLTYNKFKTLEGAPREIKGHFIVNSNPSLKSLKGGPERVFGDYLVQSIGTDDPTGKARFIGGQFLISKATIGSE